MSISKFQKAMDHIDDDLVSEAVEYKRTTKKNTLTKWIAVAACLCLAVVGVTAIMPKNTHKQAMGTDAAGAQTNEMYSVAILPVGRNLDDVQDAYYNEVTQEEAQNEAGLSDYLPSKLPNGYHFGNASIYVTTMKDGTVCKMLRVTYTTGEEYKASADGNSTFSQDTDGFRISIFDCKPDTSREIYPLQEIRENLTSGNIGSRLFYIEYGDYYVGIDPLSLRTEEIIDLIDSIDE